MRNIIPIVTNTTKRIPRKTPSIIIATGSFFPDDRPAAGNIPVEDIGEVVDDGVDVVIDREAGE